MGISNLHTKESAYWPVLLIGWHEILYRHFIYLAEAYQTLAGSIVV
jgi:hypothetical protein